MTVRVSVQGATFNMRGQLYRGHANASALSSNPVASALGSESDDPGSIPGRGKALCPWTFGKKKRELHFLAWLNLDITLQKLRAGGWGWGWGLTDTHIDMSSFYLRNEFFFSLELRRHSETTLHNGDSPLAEANV